MAQKNGKEELQLIEDIELLIYRFAKKGNPLIGLVIKPIQFTGSINNDSFYKKLRDLCDEKNLLFICDETDTAGGKSGKWWAYEHWKLKTPPDVVVFGPRLNCSGFYFRTEKFGNISTDSEMCHHSKFGPTFEIVAKYDLLSNATMVGQFLVNELKNLATQHKSLMNIRRPSNVPGGRGTMIGWDMPNELIRDMTIKKAMQQGLLLTAVGNHTIILNLSLTFAEYHARQFLEIFENCLPE